MEDSAIWVEKYRPKSFDEIKGQKEIVSRIRAFTKIKNLPHMLFAGPAGIGKTSLILVAAKELYGESWRDNVLELNASDERGIDVVRNTIKDFARTKAIGNVPFKICILDESDSLTREAQQALRRTMENFSQTCRFCLLANFSSKIIEPIQSRCTIFRFKPLQKENIFEIIEWISKNEKLKIDKKTQEVLYEISEGDVRKLENMLQSCSVMSKEITEKMIYDISSIAEPKEIKKVLEIAIEGDFIKARDLLLDIMLKRGLSGLDIIKQIQKEIWNLDINDERKVKLVDKCGEIEFRMSEGSDEFIQLESLLVNFIGK
jgi:replication factor C small subunit